MQLGRLLLFVGGMASSPLIVYGNPHFHPIAYDDRDTAHGITADACGPQDLGDYDLGLHIIGIFVLLVVSGIGIYGTIFLGSSKYKSQPTILLILQILKFFGSGVIIATAWMHMIPSSFAQFTSPCLDGGWAKYGGGYVGLFALIAAFLVQSIEFGAMSRRDKLVKANLENTAILKQVQVSSPEMLENAVINGSVPHHHHGHNHTYGTVAPHSHSRTLVTATNMPHHHHIISPNSPISPSIPSTTTMWPVNVSGTTVSDESHLEHVHPLNGEITLHDVAGHSHAIPTDDSLYDFSTLMLELGIAFHSVIIGLALGVATDEWHTLVIALSFHQLFEGMALGTRIAELNTSLFSKLFCYGLMYPLTTPLGAAIGVGVRSVYNANAQSLILIQGILDALSAGVLMYNAYVELISVEMNHNPSFRAQAIWRKSVAFLSMWIGAAAMAVVGIWA